jgi:hypothetical protein
VTVKGNIFWNVMPCILVEIHQSFGRIYFKLATFFLLFLLSLFFDLYLNHLLVLMKTDKSQRVISFRISPVKVN